ncbi:MAG: SRPBCC domain-containing protein [Candidatus Zixiibacteriota bacterium]
MPEMFDKEIRRQSLFYASPERIYDTITSGSGWNAFFTFNTEVDPRPGGEIVFRWKDRGPQKYTVNAEGKVHRAERPHIFVFERYPVGREHPTIITFERKAQDDATVVSITESGYPNTPDGRAMILECASGWDEAVTLLKFYFEYGVTYHQAADSSWVTPSRGVTSFEESRLCQASRRLDLLDCLGSLRVDYLAKSAAHEKHSLRTDGFVMLLRVV